jgi:hypothetical protein
MESRAGITPVRGLARFRFALVLPAAVQPACISFHSYETIDVRVVDAETDQPIPGVAITVDYPRSTLYGALLGKASFDKALVINVPRTAKSSTNQDGETSVEVANYKHGAGLRCEAPGYWPQVWVPIHRRGPIPNKSSLAAFDTANRTVSARFFREPHPAVTVVVPEGYRGPLGVRLAWSDDFVGNPAGKREYVYAASPTGLVDMEPLTILWFHNALISFAACAPGGERIPAQGDLPCGQENGVALWFVAIVPGGAIYSIGDQGEWEAVRQAMKAYVDERGHFTAFSFDSWNTAFNREGTPPAEVSPVPGA